MKNIILTLLTLLAFQTVSFGQQEVKTNDDKKVLLYEDGTWMYADSIPLNSIKATTISNLEIPFTSPKDNIITHKGYSLLYNEKHEQADWVAYELTKEETTKLYERTDKFIIDPNVKSGSASDKDYEGSGYDRGHLAPASDMGWSSSTMSESFYYSNMSPQEPSFNRGIWKKLEELVRTWAIENKAIYIVTGPVLTNDLQSIGPDKVSVPKYFYKVILDYSEPNIKSIGFILPNSESKDQLQNFAVSIDSVEKLTGIDFFPLLQDDQEEQIEKVLCLKCWSWKSIKTSNENKEDKASESVQCKGLTKSGEHCKNKTLNLSGFCFKHENQNSTDNTNNNNPKSTSDSDYTVKNNNASVQCSATTKSGKRCKRMTTNSNGRCFQH